MFLISAPVEDCDEANLLKLKAVALNYATFSNIPIPEFRTAPAAVLHELAKDLSQLDHAMENLLHHLLSTFESVLRLEGVDLLEHLVIEKQIYKDSITNFTWNTVKYSPYLSLNDLCDLFYKDFRDLDHQMRKNVATHKENLKIATEYVFTEETLATQDLTRIILKETVIDTEYIQSVYVAVPHQLSNTWSEVYETLHDSVVACSSCFVAEDSDYKLYSVAIVRDAFLEFRQNCAKIGFIAREYSSDQDKFALKIHERRKVEEATQYQNIMLIQWLKVIADDMFEVLIHIKVFRAYVGSLIRYDHGKFQITMFYPRKSSSQQLQSELEKIYEEQEYATGQSNLESTMNPEGSHLPYLIYKVSFPFPEY